MYLVLATALIAACSADKLDRTYLPPATAHTAGGSPGSLQTPFRSSNQGLGGLPTGGGSSGSHQTTFSSSNQGIIPTGGGRPGFLQTPFRSSNQGLGGLPTGGSSFGGLSTGGGSSGSLQTRFRSSNQGLGGLPTGGYQNNFDGVVVDAAAPGTRASGQEVSGLGGPRLSYGSTDSKVGEAAFTADGAFPRVGVPSGETQTGSRVPSPERPQASRDRASNTVKYESDVSPDSFNYAFETDNGIVAEENGIEVNGVKAQGGYSYTGDDGQVYSVTYTADEGGYQPKGDHLPTPPPIPEEILKSLEQNAKEEAAGIVDDGSYDAQKYSGEDYTKSDSSNEKSNRQPTFGNRPQTDAVSSSSFINQNNQVARPNFNQFGSDSGHSTSAGSGFDSSKNKFGGNNFGISHANKNTQSGQTFGSGSGSNNEYLPPGSGYNPDRRPSFNNQPQTIPNNQQSTFNQNGASLSSTTGSTNKNSEPSFIPLSQQKLQEDSSRKPQARPIFGKPTIIDSSLSIKDPFGNRPSNNRFTQNKQPVQRPQNNGQVGGSFEVVSGNVYSSKNEYLPPRRQSNVPNQNKGQSFQTPSSRIPVGSNSPYGTAFASVSRPTTLFPSQGNNGQQQYNTQQFQNGGSGLSNLISNANSRLPLNKGQSQFSSGISTVTGFDSSSASESQYKPSNFGSQSPTLQPQTELTTPFESSNQKGSAPIPIVDGPDSPSLGGASSNLPSFSSQPSNSFFGQSSFNTQKFQQVAPTQASATAFSSIRGPIITSGQQNNPSGGLIQNNIGTQFPNRPTFDVQYSSSTPKPSFSSNSQQQGADDSYYYNTPFRPLNIPTPRPDTSRFPSSPSDQPFRVTQTPFGTKPQIFSQNNKPNQGSTKYPRPPTLEPISPTIPSIPFKDVSNTFSSQFNGVTQASASVFPSPTSAPEQSTQFEQEGPGSSNPFIQALQPERGQDSKPDSSTGSSSQFQQTNQYNSEIYEYKKPQQTLPAPQNTPSQQTAQTSQFGASSVQSSGSYKPTSHFGSSFTQQTISNGQPQSSQGNQAFNSIHVQGSQSNSRPGPFGSQTVQTPNYQGPNANQFNYNGESQTQFQSESRPTQFPLKPTSNFQTSQGNQAFNFNTQGQPRPQSEKPGQFSLESQNSRPVQGASKFPPVYDKEGADCCKQALGSQSSQENQNSAALSGSQISNQGSDIPEPASQDSKPVQSVSNFAGVAESFGGPRKPPSFDANGYHY